MGINDRDYIRQRPTGLFGPILERGTICKWLISITVVVFVLQLISPRERGEIDSPFGRALWLSVQGILDGQIWRLLTYPFVHWGMWSILWNMLFLWWFGREIEDIYGAKEFLLFYITVTVLAGAVYLVFPLAAGVPLAGGRVPIEPLFSASAPVLAILVMTALHYPTKIINLFFILPVPIWLAAIFHVAFTSYSFLSILGHRGEIIGLAGLPGALLAAAAFALLYYKYQWRVSNWWPDFKSWQRRRRRPRLRIHTEDEEETPTPVTVAPSGLPAENEQLDAKVDAILEKISRSGTASLTESEQQVLQKASEAIRKRRT
jgi:membrane associated rhomboid family serine protease